MKAFSESKRGLRRREYKTGHMFFEKIEEDFQKCG